MKGGFLIVWIVFFCLFASLAGLHFSWVPSKLPKFSLPSARPLGDLGQVTILGSDIDQTLADFTARFNAHLDILDAKARASNLAAGWGYLVAAGTAAASLSLSLKDRRSREATDGDAQEELSR